MLKKISLVAVFFYLSLNAFAQKSSMAKSSADQGIRQIMALQEAAWNRGNLDSFMMFYWNSPELRFVSKKGIKYGWNSVYEGYKKNYSDKGEMGKLSFQIHSIDGIDKKNNLVTGSWKVENKSGIFEGYFTLWFKKIKGSWFIILDHTS